MIPLVVTAVREFLLCVLFLADRDMKLAVAQCVAGVYDGIRGVHLTEFMQRETLRH